MWDFNQVPPLTICLHYVFDEISGGIPGSLDYDYYCHALDTEDDYLRCDWNVAGNASEYLRDALHASESTYTFVYLGHVDNVGHADGWCTQPYLDMVAEVDLMIGLILDAIEQEDMEDEVSPCLAHFPQVSASFRHNV